jgi:hypothetical protein
MSKTTIILQYKCINNNIANISSKTNTNNALYLQVDMVQKRTMTIYIIF